jgi:hypothetical protein
MLVALVRASAPVNAASVDSASAAGESCADWKATTFSRSAARSAAIPLARSAETRPTVVPTMPATSRMTIAAAAATPAR